MNRKVFTDNFTGVYNDNGLNIDTNCDLLMLGLGITNRCNYNCPMCYYHDSQYSNPVIDMTYKFIEELLLNIGFVYLINLSLEGEPFLHPDILSVIDLVSQYSKRVVICSNGSVISEKHCIALEKLENIQLVLSVDASNADGYVMMRKGGNFERFTHNATMLSECLGNRVEFTSVICANNISYLEMLPVYANSVGIKKINLNLLRETNFTKHNGLSKISLSDLDKLLLNLYKYENELDIKIEFSDKNMYKQKCTLPFYYTSILSDGSLFPCCGDFEPEKIEKYNFDGIFNHTYLSSIRANLIVNRTMLACTKCNPLR